MVLEMLPLLTLLEQRRMKHLNSRARAQVDDGVPPVCWAGSRVPPGRDFVKCVLAQRDFARAMCRRAWMCQSLWGSGS